MTTPATGVAAQPAPAPTAEPARWRREVRAFGEVFALHGFAIAQPLLDIFGRAPDQFIFRGADRRDILVFALLVTFAIPLVLWLVELLVAVLAPSFRARFHAVALGVLGAVFGIQVLRNAFSGWPVLFAGALVGLVVGLLYVRTRGMRIWLAFASVAPFAFLAVFLFASQTSPLLKGPVGTLGEPIRRPGPVVVLVFDELPLASLLDAEGQIDADLYPNFSRLAGTSHWFRNTTAVSNFTWTAVPSIVTGELPADDTTPDASSHPNNIFTLLGGAMPVFASEAVTRLCPSSVCEHVVPPNGGLGGILRDAREVLGQRLAPNPSDRDPVAGMVEQAQAQAEAERPGAAEQPTDTEQPADPEQPGDPDHEEEDRYASSTVAAEQRFLTFVQTLGHNGPALHYLHLLLPHVPYRYLPDGTSYDGPDPDLGRKDDRWTEDQTVVDLGHQRHLLQLMYADALLGTVLDTLEQAGRFDEATVVVVGDHGNSFVPGQSVRGLSPDGPPDAQATSEIMWVPFLVKEPGQTEGEISDADVRTVDVVPTLAEILGVELPWQVDGRSALSGEPRDEPTKAMYLNVFEGTRVARGDEQTVDAAEGFDRVRAAAAGRFAPRAEGSTGADRIFRIGPRPDLWKRPVSELVGVLDRLSFERIERSEPDLARRRVPALVRATVASAAVGEEVAVAVNGQVLATTRVFDLGSGPQVAAILPAAAFADGQDQVALYAITG